MDTSEQVKKDIEQKYDQEAQELDNEAWLRKGDSARVPESASSHYFIDRKVDKALELYGLEQYQGVSALEIGCSFGHMTSLLARKFEDLTAVDLSEDSVQVAEKRLNYYGLDHVNFVADDAEQLNKLPDEEFDVIFSFSTIRYCPNPDDAMKAIYRKLKPGGIAIIDFPNKNSPWHFLIKTVLGIRKHMHDTLYNQQKAEEMLRSAGFKNINSTPFLFTTKRLPSFLLPVSKAVDAICERIPGVRKLAGIIMVRGEKQ